MIPPYRLRSLVGAFSCLFLVSAICAAEQIKYSTGAVLDVDLGCKKKNGKKDQLIWSASRIKDIRSGRVNLSYLRLMDSNFLSFRHGVGGQSIYVTRLVAETGSNLTISGQGSLVATVVSGGGNIALTHRTQTLELGAGSIGVIDASLGTVSLKKTEPQNLIVGHKASVVGLKAAKVTVNSGGTLAVSGKSSIVTATVDGTLTSTDSTISTANVKGTLTAAGKSIIGTATVDAAGSLTVTGESTITTATVNGDLTATDSKITSATVKSGGTLTAAGKSVITTATVDADGSLTSTGESTITTATVNGDLIATDSKITTATVKSGGTLTASGATIDTATVENNGTLELRTSASLAVNSISNNVGSKLVIKANSALKSGDVVTLISNKSKVAFATFANSEGVVIKEDDIIEIENILDDSGKVKLKMSYKGGEDVIGGTDGNDLIGTVQ